MDSQTKQQIKKKLRFYTRLSFICIATFILGFIIILTVHKIMPDYVRYAIGGITIASPFVGLFTAGTGQAYQYKINRYRNSIREYRTRVLFQKVVQIMQSGDLKSAIDIYNTMPNGHLKDFLYAYFIGASKYSDDEKVKARGAEILESIIDEYQPNKVEL
jgi:hypothetical protein